MDSKIEGIHVMVWMLSSGLGFQVVESKGNFSYDKTVWFQMGIYVGF